MSFLNIQLNESKNDQYKIYLKCFTEIFEKIKNYLSKRNQFYNEIMIFIKTYPEELQKDKETKLNGDKYFPIIAKSLETENIKITETVLFNLKLLIQNNLLLGRTKDSPLLQQNPKDLETKNRKMIDTIVETLTRLDYIKDESIWINISDVLNELVINNQIYLNGKPIDKIYKFYIRVYLKCRNEQNCVLINTKIELLVEILYEKMIKYKGGNAYNSYNYHNYSTFDRKLSNTSKNTIDRDNTIINEKGIRNNLLLNTYFNLRALNVMTIPSVQLDKNPINIMSCRLTKEIVDIICINDYKKTKIRNLIPKTDSEINTPAFRHLSKPNIMNENYKECGFFGWCYICRNKADYYCKETRKAVCSYKCKEIIEKEEDLLEHYIKGEIILDEDLGNMLYNDCIGLFKYLCGLITLDSSNIKAKLISFGIIKKILQNYGEKYLKNKLEFIQLIQDDLTEGIFKNCVSENVDVFEESINLIFIIWQIFREYLKVQISICNETVLLRILASENSSYIQKKIVLECFSKQTLIYFIELYANYDCVLNENFLVTRIATALNSIAQGKYIKTEQSFSDEENYQLRKLALTTLSSLIDSIFEFCEKCPEFRNKNEFMKEPQKNINEDLTPSGDDTTIVTDTDSIVGKDSIDLNLKRKFDIQNAVDKFNIKISTGLLYLKKKKMIDCSNPDKEARDIMNFLRNTPGLKKEYIGEYLGDNSEMSLKVLKYFAQSFDFEGFHIVQALRLYLSTFQLPGEGQKIDRILENFAAKYHNDNPDLYATADTAYYLAFAIILLQTELHNPNVKSKMSFESFSKMLDGQNGHENLSPIYLRDIYDQISSNPISLPELDEEKDKLENKKEDKYKRERTRIINECSEKLKQSKDTMYKKVFYIEEYLNPFMENIWTPIFAMYSVILEESDDYTLYSKCINGIGNCIKICGILSLGYQKGGFITSLLTMTNLAQAKEMSKKNILCIKEILSLANGDCRYCNDHWNLVFDLVNKIYFDCLYDTGSKSEKEAIINKIIQKAKKNVNIEREIEIEKTNMKIVSKEISQNEYEKIFVKTVRFGINYIQNFIDSLCKLAIDQFKENEITKIFWMQKIVEVSELNLFRVRMEWNIIWPTIRDLIVQIGLSQDINDSITSVDSLRQLALKYLQMKETSDFHFQKEFFLPFQEIWEKSKNIQTKDYVISCINNLVLSQGKSIKSGWIIIFNIYETVTNIDNITGDIIERTLDTFYSLAKNNFEDICEYFSGFGNCLYSFCKSSPDKILSILDFCVIKISKLEDFNYMFKCYMVIMQEQVEVIRQKSMSKMQHLIKQGLTSSSTKYLRSDKGFWNFLINKTIIPLIPVLIKERYTSTLLELLKYTVILFNDYFESNYYLLNTFFNCLGEEVINSKIDVIINTGIECMDFILKQEKMKNMEFLHCFLILLISLLNKILPEKVLNLNHKDLSIPSKKEKYREIVKYFVTDCILIFNLLKILSSLIEKYILVINEEDLKILLDSLEKIFKLSYKFNSNIDLRISITNYLRDYMDLKIAVLFMHQHESIKLFFEILNKMYSYNSNDANKEFCASRILESSVTILQWLVDINTEFFKDQEKYERAEEDLQKDNEEKEKAKEEQEKEIQKEKISDNLGASVLNDVFPSILKVSFYKNEKFKDKITQLLFELILCNLYEIRSEVKEILKIVFENIKK